MLPQNPTQTLEKIIEKSTLTNDVNKEAEVKQLVKHVLPKEQQIYFAQITSLLTRNDKETDDIILTIRQGLGLQLLVPYFIQFSSEMVARNIRNLAILRRMMKLLKALLENKNVFIEPYLHQMMPVILTCLVGKRLSASPTEDHWSLRDFAAKLIEQICMNYKNSYTTIQPRVTKTLLRALLDPSKPLVTHYGAIQGLSALGYQVVKHMLIPQVKNYGEILEPFLKSDIEMIKFEASKCYQALLVSIYRTHNIRV
jgi:transcription initiation factor TFIID subunit 6